MFRLDPAQAVLNHVSRKGIAAGELSAEARAIVAAPIEASYPSAVIVGIAQAIEAALLATLGFAIFASYVEPGQQLVYLPTIAIATLFANILFNAARTHRITAYRTAVQQTWRVLASWSLVFIVLMTFAFLLKSSDMVSRVWLVSWYASGALVLVLFRLSLRALVMQWTREGRLKRRTAIVGGGHDAEVLLEQIRASAGTDVRLLGLFDDRNDERSPESVASLPKLGRVSDLLEFARQTRVDLVIVSMPLSAEKRVLEMLTQLWVLPVDIRLSAHMSKLRFTSKSYSYVGDVPVFDMVTVTDWLCPGCSGDAVPPYLLIVEQVNELVPSSLSVETQVLVPSVSVRTTASAACAVLVSLVMIAVVQLDSVPFTPRTRTVAASAPLPQIAAVRRLLLPLPSSGMTALPPRHAEVPLRESYRQRSARPERSTGPCRTSRRRRSRSASTRT